MKDCISNLVSAVSSRPADLSLRLDLADCLQACRKPGLARWMRQSLARGSALANINATFPTAAVWGDIRVSTLIQPAGADPVQQWEDVCPDYWQAPVSCSFVDYYGRWLISCAATSLPLDRSAVDELASMLWLKRLWEDGLLEVIEYQLGNSETAEWAIELPPEIQGLPFFLNTACAFDRLTMVLSRRILSFPSLIGLYLTTGTFAKGIARELPALAPGLQFLNIESSRKSTELDELFYGIESFSDLRLLSLVGEYHPTADNLMAIGRSTSVNALGISSIKLDRQGLFTVGSARNLRWLGINSERLRRQDLDAFRKEFPDVRLLLSEDMQTRLGPA